MHLLHNALKVIFYDLLQDVGPCKSELEYVNALVLFGAIAAQTTICYHNNFLALSKNSKMFFWNIMYVNTRTGAPKENRPSLKGYPLCLNIDEMTIISGTQHFKTKFGMALVSPWNHCTCPIFHITTLSLTHDQRSGNSYRVRVSLD